MAGSWIPGMDYHPLDGSEAFQEIASYQEVSGIAYQFRPGETVVVCNGPGAANWVREWFFRSKARGDFPADATYEAVGGDTREVTCTIRYPLL